MDENSRQPTSIPGATSLARMMRRAVGWVRAGYPAHMPRRPHVSLAALRPGHLSDSQIAGVAGSLVHHDGALTDTAIRSAVTVTARRAATQNDVDRVRAALGGKHE